MSVVVVALSVILVGTLLLLADESTRSISSELGEDERISKAITRIAMSWGQVSL